MLKSIKLLLNINGVAIIEVQYLYDLISQKGFDSFHHEHNYYFTLSSIIKVLKNYNLHVFNAEKLRVHGGILRIYVSTSKRKIKTRKLRRRRILRTRKLRTRKLQTRKLRMRKIRTRKLHPRKLRMRKKRMRKLRRRKIPVIFLMERLRVKN